MDPVGVVSSVTAVVSTFHDAAAIVQRIKSKCAERRVSLPPRLLEEALATAPLEIEKVKDRGVERFGRAFEQGDYSAILAIQDITIQLQGTLLAKLHDVTVGDGATGFTALVNAADIGRDGTIAALLELRTRLLQQGPQQNLSDSQTTESSPFERSSHAYRPPLIVRHHRSSDDRSSGLPMDGLQRTFTPTPTQEDKNSSRSPRQRFAFFEKREKSSVVDGHHLGGVSTKGPQRSLTSPADFLEAEQATSGRCVDPRTPAFTYQEGEDNPFEIWGSTRLSTCVPTPLFRYSFLPGSYEDDAPMDSFSIASNSNSSSASTRAISDTSTFGSGHSHISTSASSVSDTPTPYPSPENNYLGFCKGAWRLQNGDQKRAVVLLTDWAIRSNGASLQFLGCSKCKFECHSNPKTVWTQVWTYDSLGIKLRWPFLAKSHVMQKAALDRPSVKSSMFCYKCMFCVYDGLGAQAPVIHSLRLYLHHISETHRGRIINNIALYKTCCINDHVCEENERFDINLYPTQDVLNSKPDGITFSMSTTKSLHSSSAPKLDARRSHDRLKFSIAAGLTSPVSSVAPRAQLTDHPPVSEGAGEILRNGVVSLTVKKSLMERPGLAELTVDDKDESGENDRMPPSSKVEPANVTLTVSDQAEAMPDESYGSASECGDSPLSRDGSKRSVEKSPEYVTVAPSTGDFDWKPKIDSLEALLNPEEYFQSLDDLETDLIEQSRIKKFFAVEPGAAPRIFEHEHSWWEPNNRYNWDSELADGISLALKLLQEYGYCRESVILLVDDLHRDGVVNALEIAATDVESIVRFTKNPFPGFSRIPAWHTILGSFGIDGSQYSKISHSGVLRLLLLGLVSYTGSHCSSLEQKIWSDARDTVDSDHANANGAPVNGKHIAFRRRNLSCLDGFIGSPVWVFGQAQTTEPAMLSISIKQLTDLWGPTFAIPLIQDREHLIALKVEGGVIYCVDEEQDGEMSRMTDGRIEVLMHFMQTESFGKEILPDGTCSDKLMYRPSARGHLPDPPQPFRRNARLLIGHPTQSVTCTAVDATPQEQLGGRSLSTKSHCSSLIINADCDLDVKKFGRDHTNLFHLMGTHTAHYVPDQYQVSFGAGQYVNAGVQRVWRRRPASTYKNRLLEYCSNCTQPEARIDSILDLRLGLEVSVCTGNARRITMREVLALAHPNSLPTLQIATDAGDLSVLSAYMKRISKTGTDEANRLSLFWPFDDGLPYVVDVSDALPNWSKILKETDTSACFAVMSARCMTYQERDKLVQPPRKLTQACHGRVEKYLNSFLETTVNLHPDSRPQLPLKPGARIRIGDGFIEMRNQALAFHGTKSLSSMVGELWICTNDGRKGHVHSELLDPRRASNYTLSVCIMDYPRRAPHAGPDTYATSVPLLSVTS